MILEQDSEQIFKAVIDEKPEAAMICEASDHNPNYWSILYANAKFYEIFEISEDNLIGKSYDFLFDDFDLDYSSEDNIEYVRLIKAVKDYHQCSVIVNISNRAENPEKSRVKIDFSPTNLNQDEGRRYSTFTFEKAQSIADGSVNKIESNANEALLRNLQRRLRGEKLLREVANLIISDLPIKEIAQNIANILAEHLKANRCVIHDYKEGEVNFTDEYRDSRSKSMIEGDKEKITRYINFQSEFYKRFGNKNKRSSVTAVEDLSRDQNFSAIEDVWREFSILSQIAVTTTFNEKINGGIYIHQSSPRVWMQDEIELVEIIADQFSIALDRSDSIERVMVSNHTLMERSIQLREALKHEKEMRKMQNEFVALVSHEFKTPLQIIDSTRELVERKIRNGINDESVSKALERIKSGVYRMNGLINSVLNLAKIESGESSIKLERAPFNLKHLIDEIVDKNSTLAVSKNIKILTKLEEIDFDFNGDVKLLDHAFTNIIANAIKYSKNDTSVKIVAKTNDKTTAVRVIDQGIGIPKDDVSSIGKKFFRAKNTTAVAGTGIGIYLTKNFIEMHEGQMLIESELNVGTSVTVVLPRV
jgi:signal transduction histidine kinase